MSEPVREPVREPVSRPVLKERVQTPVPQPVVIPVQLPVVQNSKPIPAFELPDITEEVLEHLVELHADQKDTSRPKTTMLVKPSLSTMARRDLHYNIMKDIEKRQAEITIGQLLKDSPAYRKQVMDAVKTRRKRRLPSTISDVRFTEVEDWGAPEIDTEIEGCMITQVPVDGGSGVNVMLEQTASDLGYTKFEPTPKILRMANQEEVIPVGKLSQVLTRMGDLEYRLNYVVIRLPIESSFQVLLGRPWLYKAGVLEDWKKKEFRIGSVRIPWKVPEHMGETPEGTDDYTNADSDGDAEAEVSDCWLVVNAFKAATEEQLGFPKPEEEHVQIHEAVDSDADDPLQGSPVDPTLPVTGLGPVELDVTGTQPVLITDDLPVLSTKEQHALGVLDVPLTREWVHKTLTEDPGMQGYYGDFHRSTTEDPSPIVKALEYEKLIVKEGMDFWIGSNTPEAEKEDLKSLLIRV